MAHKKRTLHVVKEGPHDYEFLTKAAALSYAKSARARSRHRVIYAGTKRVNRKRDLPMSHHRSWEWHRTQISRIDSRRRRKATRTRRRR